MKCVPAIIPLIVLLLGCSDAFAQKNNRTAIHNRYNDTLPSIKKPTVADSIGTITGRVVDEAGQPVIGAVIEAFEDGIKKGGAVTDDSGVYIIRPLFTSVIALKVAYTSYPTIDTVVQVQPGRSITLDFALKLLEPTINISLPKVIQRGCTFGQRPYISQWYDEDSWQMHKLNTDSTGNDRK